MSTMVIGGRWDNEGGRPSKIVDGLARSLGWPCRNGGYLCELEEFSADDLNVLLWMPDISNEYGIKFLPRLKAKNKSLLLISSKQCRDTGSTPYRDSDVIGHMLKNKVNLGIAIHECAGSYSFKLLDPLGNQFADTSDITVLQKLLALRVRRINRPQVLRITSVEAFQWVNSNWPCGKAPINSVEEINVVDYFPTDVSTPINISINTTPITQLKQSPHSLPREFKWFNSLLKSRDKITIFEGSFTCISLLRKDHSNPGKLRLIQDLLKELMERD